MESGHRSMSPRQLKRFFENFPSQLARFRNISQEGAEIKINKQKAQYDTSKEMPWTVHPQNIPDQGAQIEANNERRHRQGHRQQVWLTWGTWLAFIAASIYAWLAHDQLHTMNDTYKQMRSQTHLMETQVEAATAAIIFKQFRISWPESNRAYLSVILDNRGRVEASKIQGRISIAEVSIRNGKEISKHFPVWKFAPQNLAPSAELPLEVGAYLDISPKSLRGTDGVPNALKLTGTFTYFNGFRQRVDGLCYYILGTAEFRNKSGILKESIGSTVITCGALPAELGSLREIQRSVESN